MQQLRTSGLVAFGVAFILALPAAAVGQAVQPAALAGTWVYRRDGGELFDSIKGQLVVTYLTVEPNGTFAYDGKIQKSDGEWRPWGVGWAKGSWRLAADTLRFTDDRGSSVAYKVALQDGQLFLWTWDLWDANRRAEKCAAKAFERLDASKPLTLPPLQVTIRPVDLMGTWKGTSESKYGPITDKIVFHENQYIIVTHGGWPRSISTTGRPWKILPGDQLEGPGLGRHKIVLQNGELVVCTPVMAVLKRVAP